MLDYHFRLTISLLQTIGTEKKSVTINFSFTFNRETWRNRNMVADTKVINAFENDIGWRRRIVSREIERRTLTDTRQFLDRLLAYFSSKGRKGEWQCSHAYQSQRCADYRLALFRKSS